MTQTYEQIADREHQGIVAADIGEAWDVEVFPMPEFSVADFLLLSRRDTIALAELKWRNNHREQYRTLILSMNKLNAIVGAAEALRLPFFLFIGWLDGVFWRRVSAVDLPSLTVTQGGREDRGDQNDQELVYHIPIQSFRPLKRALFDIDSPPETTMQ